MLYVSHSPDEVARLASHLVLLQAGHVKVQGPTAELMTRLDLPLSHGDTAAALVQAQVLAHDAHDHLLSVAFSGGRLHLIATQQYVAGEAVRLRVLARDVSLARTRATDSSILNLLPARITQLAEDSPGQMLVALDAAGTALLARITRRSCQQLALAVGDTVFAQVKGVALVD
jgi:molybdate transport system ATP-binding protein